MFARKFFIAITILSTLAACNVPTTSVPNPTLPPSIAPSTLIPNIVPSPTQVTPPRLGGPTLTPIAQLGSPQCFVALPLTPAQTEGPYFKPGSPERKTLVEPGMTGTRITLTGFVMRRDCQSVANAKVDVWQTDDKGEYDNVGYRMRGHTYSAADGRYTIETIIPGLYPGRTRHIHVQVITPKSPVLTTQVYFPDEAQNQRDSIFDRALLAKLQDTPNGKIATFNFVLDVR